MVRSTVYLTLHNRRDYVTREKFLEQSAYSIVINSAFTFLTKNIFGCFHDVMAQFELVKHRTTLHIHLYGVKPCTSCQRTNYHDTTNYIGYYPLQIELCPWCNGYRRRKWTRRHEFKSWTRPIAFHIALIPLGKVWIQ